jgi:hypothetical protein
VLGGRTVIGAGGGLYYGPGQFEDLIQPIESNVLRSTTSFATGIDSNTATRVSTDQRFRRQVLRRVFMTSMAIASRSGSASTECRSSSSCREIPARAVAYVGSQGRNLFQQRNITNVILPGTATVAAGQPLPGNVGIVDIVNADGRVNGGSPDPSVQPDQQDAREQRQCCRQCWECA